MYIVPIPQWSSLFLANPEESFAAFHFIRQKVETWLVNMTQTVSGDLFD
jgi:succinate dehydrogenase/fumarate reductase cytochrome b subunit